MNTYTDKTQENKSQAVSNEVSKRQSGKGSSFQLVDNRPEAILQRRLQELANNTPMVNQVRAFQEMASNGQPVNQASQGASAPAAVIQRFGEGTLEEMKLGEEFEALLDEYSQESGLIRFRYQIQWEAFSGTEHEDEIEDDLLRAKFKRVELHKQILGMQDRVRLDLLDPYYEPLLAEIREGIDSREDDVRRVEDPKRIGKEIEFPSLTIKFPPGVETKNGILLAYTEAQELELPVLKIESEGCDRGSPSIELIYGPLPVGEYENTHFIAARRKLYDALSSGNKMLSERFNEYSESLEPEEMRYGLIPTDTATQTRSTGKGIKPNIQTNVAVPYRAIGAKEEGIDSLFEGETSEEIFIKSRDYGNSIAGGIPGDGPGNLASLMTQIIYHDIMYGMLMLEKGKEKKVDKQKFHVMLKASPQDVVFSILTEIEVLRLHLWIRETKGKAITDIQKEFDGELFTGSRKTAAKNALKASVESLRNAVKQRLIQGKQTLEKVKDDTTPSTTRSGTGVRHHMPRPTNRIPVLQDGKGNSYIVIEQRSSKHPLNRFENNM